MTRIKNNLLTLFFLGFFQSVAIALPFYIQSNFLSQFVSLRMVGWFFIVAMAATIVAIDFLPYCIKKFSNYSMSLLLLLVYLAVACGLVFAHSLFWVFILFTLLTVSSNLMVITMDVFVERFSRNAVTGQIRTIFYTVINTGWVVSALLISRVLAGNNYRLIFLLVAVFALPVLLTLFFQKSAFQDHIPYEHHRTWRTLKNIWRSLNLRGIFAEALLLELFYACFAIYMPIYLHQTLGFSWGVIGLMFAIMLVPFLLIEIPAGILADKYLGEKEMMIFGMIILAATSASMFVCNSTSPLVWTLLFFFSRCGAALMEAMRETYFFKIVDVEEIDYINFFRTIFPLGYLLSSVLGIIILSFYPVNYIFLFLAIILLSGIYFAARLKDTK